NPGREYLATRHNAGFQILDAFLRYFQANTLDTRDFHAQIAKISLPSKLQILLVKPQTYMNESGLAIAKTCSYYRIPTSQTLIIHDELDLALGAVRFKSGGGHAGHNGLKSIDKTMGSGYHRIRVGIGRPASSMSVADYVLGNFTNNEQQVLELVTKKLIDMLPQLLSHLANNNFNLLPPFTI
ncbi:MAG: aminoacyl-tRNA hydrolase, partial [Candidatus Nitrosoglobus sp.]